MKSVAKRQPFDWFGTRVLITGAAGFVGSHLSERLAQLGAELTLVDDYSNATLSREQLLSNQPISQMHVCSPELIHMLNVVCPHVIFHLAGYAYAAGSVDEPVCDMNGNLVSTFELLEALRSIRFSGLLVYASSAAVYGEPQSLPMTEEHPTHPISPYGVSKLAAERYVSVYSSLYHIPAVAVRSFSIYGPRQRKQVVYDLITKMRNHAPATLLGDGTQIRDLIYISDAVEAMLLTARRGLPDGSVYNLCSGMGTSIKQLAEEVSEILHVNTSIQFSGERRGGDPECWIGSSAKIESLGFTPEVSLSEGLRRTIDWHLKYSHGGPLQGEVSKC